jgi:acyl-CoA hydrolase
MEIGVRVESERWNEVGREPVHVASAYLVFVAIDEQGRPREIPGLLTETTDEIRREREAQIRRAHRLARRAEIERGRGLAEPS